MPKKISKEVCISITMFLKGWCFESGKVSFGEIDIVRKVWRGCRNELYHL